tara:strand:- start:3023 stop:5053 length:2031 start_codon:yes stop_codon:yes gene_type:complete
MRRRIFRNPMIGLSRRREKLFDSTPSDKPKSSFKLPSSDLFLTLVIVISYFLTRISYETHPIPKFGNELFLGLGLKPPKNTRLFRMNSHYKRGDRQVSDIVFLSLLAFFVFKVNWNNMGSSTNADKIAWSVSVLVAPIVINIFMENKNKHNINPDLVSSVKQFKDSNNQTKVFLSFALLLTFVVGAKLVHRTMNCKGGMTKPVLIQIIIIGTTVGLFLLAQKDISHHNSVTSNNRINSQFKKEQKKYAEQFENEWPKKHKRVVDRWKRQENMFDKDEAAFVPTSKIIQLTRETMINENLERIKKSVISQSAWKHLFKLKGLVIDEKVKLKNVWPHIKGTYDYLKYQYKSNPKLTVPEYLQTADLGDVIISISDNGKAFGLPKGDVTSGNTAYYKKIAYTIISENLGLSPSSIIKDYDTLVDKMNDVIYTKILSQNYRNIFDENNRFGKQIFNHKLDGADFKKQFEDKLKNVYVSKYSVRRYPLRSDSQITYTSITDTMLGYYQWDNKVLDTFEDFIKYHKKNVKEEKYRYRNIKGDKPTLEDVKKYDYIETRSRILDRYYDYNEKDRYVQDHITATTHGSKRLPLGDEWVYKDYVEHYKSGMPRNDLEGNAVSLTNFEKSFENKSVNQYGWVIAFLLILSFTVCKKDTIDYIIEGSLWGYLIQNIARWDDISPNLM